jgi:hypothetical protein
MIHGLGIHWGFLLVPIVTVFKMQRRSGFSKAASRAYDLETGADPATTTDQPAMTVSCRINYPSTRYRNDAAGLARANETLQVAIETACPGETFDVFDTKNGFVVRMFEDGEYVENI